MFEKGTTARAILGSFAYAGLLLLVLHLFVRFYEEPRLRRIFKASYDAYCLHVRRRLPRLTPWR